MWGKKTKNMDGSTKEKRCSHVRKLRQQFSGNPIRRNKCDLKYIARVENKIIETVEFRIKSTKNTPPPAQ